MTIYEQCKTECKQYKNFGSAQRSMTMKNMLIVCNHYAPSSEIASVRITKFAKYLAANGFSVQVITQENDLMPPDSSYLKDTDGITVYRIGTTRFVEGIIYSYKKLIKRATQRRYDDLSNRVKYDLKLKMEVFHTFERLYPVLGSLNRFMMILRDLSRFRSAKKIIKDNNILPDCCFSSYGDYLPNDSKSRVQIFLWRGHRAFLAGMIF